MTGGYRKRGGESQSKPGVQGRCQVKVALEAPEKEDQSKQSEPELKSREEQGERDLQEGRGVC